MRERALVYTPTSLPLFPRDPTRNFVEANKLMSCIDASDIKLGGK